MKYWKFLLILSLGVFCYAVFAVPPCDEKLRPVSNRTGYGVREVGIRCEGMYVSKVSRSANSLTLVGLTRGRLDFSAGETMILRSPVSNRRISIQGVGVKEKAYYRLDGVISKGKSFNWPLADVVNERGLQGDDIGLTGYFFDREHEERIFVPVDVGGQGDILLRIIGYGLFSRAFWRHAPMKQGFCGQMSTWIELSPPEFDDKPFEIILSKTLGSEFCVEVNAEPVSGVGWISGFWKIQSGG